MNKKIRSKSALYEYLIFIPTCEVREEINRIISECRKIPIEKARYKKLIRPNELKKVLDYFAVEENINQDI